MGVKIAKLSSGCTAPKPFNCFWNKPHLFVYTLLCSDSSQLTGPDILMNVFQDCIIFFIWAAWVFCKFFISRKKKKGFQSETLLKMLPSSACMKEFDPDIQK